MRIIRSVILLGLFGSLAGRSLIAQSSPIRPEAGPWQVGFAVVPTVDSTRRLTNGDPRPLDIGVWYPTRESASKTRLTYRDYFLISATGAELDRFIQFLVSHGADQANVARWLETPMHAVRDAGVSHQRFPLVLLAQGNGQTVPDQAPLAEYLAGHGYIVATTPSPMRVTGPLTDEAQVGARAAEQATDLKTAWELLTRRADVDDDRVGVIGHSFGARAGLLLMMWNPRVAALVSLDGGIGTETGRSSLESLPDFRTTAAQSAILHFYERLDDYMTPDFSLLRSLTGAERWIRQAPLRHHLFTSLGAAAIDQPALRPAIAATDSTAAAYVAVEEETLNFLNVYLKHDAAARSRLDSAATRPPLGPLERL